MALTIQQQNVLAAHIRANADPLVVAALTTRYDSELMRIYNKPSGFYVWKSQARVSDIYDQITWSSLTPIDAADATAAYTNRALVCQAKQLNMQILLQGREIVNATKANIRSGLQDALQAIPAGVGGVNVTANWAGVRTTLYREVLLAEKVFATGTGTTVSPGLAVFEGEVTVDDISDGLNRS